jgi:hypothetical protein
MPLTITLSDTLVTQLRPKAKAQKLSLQELVEGFLRHIIKADEPYPTPEEVVAKIQATPPNPANIRPATGSLAQALQNAPDDPDFDLERWTREWSMIENEMKAITHSNSIAEGRG